MKSLKMTKWKIKSFVYLSIDMKKVKQLSTKVDGFHSFFGFEVVNLPNIMPWIWVVLNVHWNLVSFT